MKNTKTFILSFIAAAFLIMPAFSHAQAIGSVYYTPTISDTAYGNNPNYYVTVGDYGNGTNTTNNAGSTTRTYTTTSNTYPTVSNNTNSNTSGSGTTLASFFGIKSQAQKDAEAKAEQEAAQRAADQARAVRNPDGSFAYGTYGSNAQYGSNANYVDARTTSGVRYTASASNAFRTNRNVAAASIGGGFLPTTFGGWILALFLIGLLVVILRAITLRYYAKNHTVVVHH